MSNYQILYSWRLDPLTLHTPKKVRPSPCRVQCLAYTNPQPSGTSSRRLLMTISTWGNPNSATTESATLALPRQPCRYHVDCLLGLVQKSITLLLSVIRSGSFSLGELLHVFATSICTDQHDVSGPKQDHRSPVVPATHTKDSIPTLMQLCGCK